MTTANDACAIALTTLNSQKLATELARTLVDKHLAACVNIVPQVISVYRWEGQVHEDPEYLLLIKTTPERVDALKAEVLRLHPYHTPEFVVLEASHAAAGYLQWLRAETRASAEPRD